MGDRSATGINNTPSASDSIIAHYTSIHCNIFHALTVVHALMTTPTSASARCTSTSSTWRTLSASNVARTARTIGSTDKRAVTRTLALLRALGVPDLGENDILQYTRWTRNGAASRARNLPHYAVQGAEHGVRVKRAVVDSRTLHVHALGDG